jgi:hypothetical protein
VGIDFLGGPNIVIMPYVPVGWRNIAITLKTLNARYLIVEGSSVRKPATAICAAA